MKTSEALREFNDSVRELAAALGITREAVYQWGETVPPLREYQIRDLLICRAKVGAGGTASNVASNVATLGEARQDA